LYNALRKLSNFFPRLLPWKRAAGWLQDLLTEKGDDDIVSLVLAEGIAGWAKGGPEYTKCIDEYDPEAWHKD
jgi:hypothetical protein